jgi:hypothetical protein
MALPHDFLQQALHGLDSVHQIIQLCQLSPGKRAPALGSSRDVAETEEELPNLAQRETDLAGSLDDGEAIQHGVVIASLPADPFTGKKDPDPFVIADG